MADENRPAPRRGEPAERHDWDNYDREMVRSVDRDIERIRDVLSTMARGMQERVQVNDVSYQEVKAKLDALDRMLRGESGEGLVARVLTLNQQTGTNLAEIKEIKAQLAKFMWFFIGLLITTIGTLITTLLQAVHK